MPRAEPRPRRLRAAGALDWIVRAVVVASGLRLLRGPATAGGDRPSVGGVVSNDSGRGRRAVPPSASAQRSGYETDDLNGRTLALLVIGMGGAVALGIGAMLLLLHGLQRVAHTAPAGLTAQQTAPIVPPAPRLQADAPGDLARLRQAEDARLNNYAWTGPAHTHGRVPIERAMALMVGRSLDAAP